MKVLILTASTGGGHRSAANNLKIAIEKNGDKAVIMDLFIKDGNPKNYKDPISLGYNIIATKLPKLYGILYKISNLKYMNNVFFKNFFMLNELEIKKIIENENIDAIISTHPFGVPIVSRVIKMSKHKIYFMQIVTDFKAHYSYIDKRVNSYIVGSEYTKRSLINNGIKEEKIHVLGIPVDEKFKTSPKREFYGSFLDILVMGGSMGLKEIKDVVRALVDSNLNIHMDIVCGNNEKLKKELEIEFKNEQKTDIIGFTNKVNELMDKADVLISKPGGLTTTEAISKNLPMIIPFAIPGQELENLVFLVDNGMAMEVYDISNITEFIKYLIDNPSKYMEMVENMKILSEKYDIQKIANLLKIGGNK